VERAETPLLIPYLLVPVCHALSVVEFSSPASWPRCASLSTTPPNTVVAVAVRHRVPTDHWPSGFAAPAPKSRPLAEPELAFRNQTSILEEVRRSAAVEIGSSEGGKTCRRNGSGPWAVSVHLSLIVSSPSCIGTFLGHLSESLQLSGLLIGWGTFLRGLLLISFFFVFLFWTNWSGRFRNGNRSGSN
jgi:hypothetical protein